MQLHHRWLIGEVSIIGVCLAALIGTVMLGPNGVHWIFRLTLGTVISAKLFGFLSRWYHEGDDVDAYWETRQKKAKDNNLP